MTGTTYHLEHASSGRAKCKKCKLQIEKGSLRIGTSSMGPNDIPMTNYCHVKCFVVPPRAMKGVSPEDFVNDHLTDNTEEKVLDNEITRQEVIADVALKPPKGAAKKKAGDDEEETPVQKKIAEIKAVMEKLPEDNSSSDEEERPSKKAKSEGNDIEIAAQALKVYIKMKNEDLKNVLRWNGSNLGGTKDNLLLRCIDGHVNGRLARCPMCFGGRPCLNDEDAGATVVCKGYFDEDMNGRIPCGYSVSASAAPRLQPWYSEEPSEEEMEAMKAVTEKHKAMASGKGDSAATPPELLKAAEDKDKDDWDDLNLREKANFILEIGMTKIDIPQDEKKARQDVGKLLMNHMELSAVDFLKEVVSEFGIASVKKEAAAKKKSAISANLACAANAGIVQAFQELKDYYFKEGNSNAGGTYQKAITALVGLDYEITVDNAKGLGKGKTKLPGIGKGSADKIHEFLSTGTIAKLEEKRLANA